MSAVSRRTAGAATVLLLVLASGCSDDVGQGPTWGGGSLAPVPPHVQGLLGSATLAMEQATARDLTQTQYPFDVVHCATQYLGDDQAAAPGGRLYLWGICEGVVDGEQGSVSSGPYRLTASRTRDGTWASVETPPDSPTDAQFERLFPARVRPAARGRGIDIDGLERVLADRRRTAPASSGPAFSAP